jgi:hypothetical protein
MSKLQTFSYDRKQISFEFADGNKMINATQMAKVFGKRINNFLRLPFTKEYILLLEKRYVDVIYNRKSDMFRDANTRNGNKIEILRVVQS